MTLFFVGKLRPEDVEGNLMALASGLCFALYFLLLRHPKAREVNRASSVIYGNSLAVLLTAPWGLAAISSLDRFDLSERYLPGGHPDWAVLSFVHNRNGKRCQVVGCRNRRVCRTSAESSLGIPHPG